MKQLFELLQQEEDRILQGFNLVASENYPSKEVLALVGSRFMSKYAEGYPGKRFYGGCSVVDEVEKIGIELAQRLFGDYSVNLQPHSGSQANQAVFQALLQPNDCVLAMDMNAGGHLTHGHKLNFSGKNYNFVFYGVDPVSELISYEEIKKLAFEHKPKMIIAGASSYPRFIDFEKISAIAREVGALFMADIAHLAGFVAAKLIPSPVGFADVVTFTTHKTLAGPRGGVILCRPELQAKIDRAVMPGIQGGPAMNVVAAKAQCFYQAMQPEFEQYQKQVLENAKILADVLLDAGLELVTNGTDTHMVLLKTDSIRTLPLENRTGIFVQELLEKQKIYCNKNVIPFEKRSPLLCSGVRFGSLAQTSLGATKQDFENIAKRIVNSLL